MAKDIKFGTSMTRLEEIVEKLENSSLDLDESMRLLEEGFKIHRSLKEKLKKSQDKIEKIVGSEEVS